MTLETTQNQERNAARAQSRRLEALDNMKAEDIGGYEWPDQVRPGHGHEGRGIF
jgi:hypothetical protein